METAASSMRISVLSHRICVRRSKFGCRILAEPYLPNRFFVLLLSVAKALRGGLSEDRLDEPKRTANLRNRGLDFADLDIEFFGASTVIPAKAERLKAIGEYGGTILTVIFKPLGSEAISVISMRRASRKERKAHGQS